MTWTYALWCVWCLLVGFPWFSTMELCIGLLCADCWLVASVDRVLLGLIVGVVAGCLVYFGC